MDPAIFYRPSGNEAFALVQDRPRHFPVVSTHRLWDRNGYKVARRLRAGKKELLINTPILAVTANAMKGDAQKAFDAGCDVYMPKPINVQELLETAESFGYKEA